MFIKRQLLQAKIYLDVLCLLLKGISCVSMSAF